MFGFGKKTTLPRREEALPGRSTPIPTASRHAIFDRPLRADAAPGEAAAMFGMGCFWGAERKFWEVGDGIILTIVGYSGGFTENPTYEETCTGRTGHNEVVRIIFDPTRVSYDDLLRVFWENHDPTQGMRQGNDIGTQYRSGIYTTSEEQMQQALSSRAAFQKALAARGYGTITTEIVPEGPFYFAEDYHQQYLAKNPHGYCGLGGTGVACPIGLRV